MTEFKSREAQFVYDLFDKQKLPENPIMSILIGQLKKLTQLVDSDPEIQAKVREILNDVKENW